MNPGIRRRRQAGPITYISREEGEKMEESRSAPQTGHGDERTWAMWKAEAEGRGAR